MLRTTDLKYNILTAEEEQKKKKNKNKKNDSASFWKVTSPKINIS